MKAVILSDSHGKVGNLIHAYEKEKDADMVMFLGDVNRDIEEFMLACPNVLVASVIGNNDFFVKSVPEDRFFEFGGRKIFMTHGHKYNSKYSPDLVVNQGKKLGADICLYGHSHRKAYDEIGGIIAVNPGSASSTYAVMTIENGNIDIEFKNID
ncbi:MAG: metallophosphoesterase [Ruminococcaceae bacterium]|nr:metallophosphoesterase [Oscillospiraceae bacterium]